MGGAVRPPSVLTAALWSLSLGACETRSAVAPPSPPPDTIGAPLADPAAVSAAARSIDSAFGTSAIRSLILLAPMMRIGAAPSAAPALTTACGNASPTMPASVAAPARISNGTIPDSLRRHVFVLESPFDSYHAGPDTSGPANGVRFVLYGLDTLGRLAAPVSPVGRFDLIDEGVGGAPRFRVELLDGAEGTAGYTVLPGAGTQAADTALLSGVVTAGMHGFTFRDKTEVAVVQLSGSTTITASIADPFHDLRLELSGSVYRFDLFDGNYALDFSFTHRGETIRLAGHVFTFCLISTYDVDVFVNGTAFGRVINGSGGPSVRDVDGQVLPADQARAILDLLQGQQRVFDTLAAFFAPARLLLPP
jgi:hypothetical protein